MTNKLTEITDKLQKLHAFLEKRRDNAKALYHHYGEQLKTETDPAEISKAEILQSKSRVRKKGKK